jgi:hypothetical protein
MSNEVDILENEIRNKYPEVLEILLRDHTTQKNIFWATDNYREFGSGYEYDSPILPELITGERGRIIMPRVKKTNFCSKCAFAIWQKFLLLCGFAMHKII